MPENSFKYFNIQGEQCQLDIEGLTGRSIEITDRQTILPKTQFLQNLPDDNPNTKTMCYVASFSTFPRILTSKTYILTIDGEEHYFSPVCVDPEYACLAELGGIMTVDVVYDDDPPEPCGIYIYNVPFDGSMSVSVQIDTGEVSFSANSKVHRVCSGSGTLQYDSTDVGGVYETYTCDITPGFLLPVPGEYCECVISGYHFYFACNNIDTGTWLPTLTSWTPNIIECSIMSKSYDLLELVVRFNTSVPPSTLADRDLTLYYYPTCSNYLYQMDYYGIWSGSAVTPDMFMSLYPGGQIPQGRYFSGEYMRCHYPMLDTPVNN